MSASDKSWFHSDEVKVGSMEEFIATWREYSSPSAAAAAIGKKWDVGRTTLFDWLKTEGQWPHTRAAESLRLAQENKRLREKLLELTGEDEL